MEDGIAKASSESSHGLRKGSILAANSLRWHLSFLVFAFDDTMPRRAIHSARSNLKLSLMNNLTRVYLKHTRLLVRAYAFLYLRYIEYTIV
jgi:hypothetical protein